MEDQIKKHTDIESNLQKKFAKIEEIIKSNERNAVKVSLIKDILGEMTDKFVDIHHKSLTDALTGFVNRRFLNEFLRKEIKTSQRYERSLSLAVMDIDCFKTVNDKFGHDMGDVVIKGISEIIKEIIRSSDVVSRYGGDEFVIVFPSTKLGDAKIVMNRIKLSVAEYDFGDDIRSGISYGLAELSGKHKLAEDLIKEADQELYKAKKKRKDPNSRSLAKKVTKIIKKKTPSFKKS